MHRGVFEADRQPPWRAVCKDDLVSHATVEIIEAAGMATEHRCGAGLLEVSLRGSALNAPPDVVLYSHPTGGTHPCFLHVHSVHTVQMHIIVFFVFFLLLSSFLHIRGVKICWE